MELLPLFPLPTVVLFPGVLLPLHVFEPRYRHLVKDALAGDRRFGIVLLRPGYEIDYEGQPPIFSIACSGVIVHAVEHDDGRYHLVLRGLDRVRIDGEDHTRSYRRGAIETLHDPALSTSEREAIAGVRVNLERLLMKIRTPGSSAQVVSSALAAMPDADFVHTLAGGLNLDALEKQALLECDGLRARAELLVDLLEMKQLEAALPPGAATTH